MAHVQGVGEVTDAQALGYYRRSGYKITGEHGKPTFEPATVEHEPDTEPERPRKRTHKAD